MAPALGLRQVYHLLMFAYFVHFDKFVFTVLVHNILAVEGMRETLKWMAPQFATVWAQFAFQDYFLLSFLEDILAFTPKTFWKPFKEILSEHANNLFTIYVIPSTLVMCVNFWVIFLIDQGHIDENNILFDILDRSTNHVVHTYVILLLLIEMCVTRRYYPTSVTEVYPYVKITITFASYYAIVFGMKLFSPVWAYPFFKAMTVSQWVLYILVNLFLSYISYAIGFICSAYVWGKHDSEGVENPSSSRESVWNGRSMYRKLLRMVQVVESR